MPSPRTLTVTSSPMAQAHQAQHDRTGPAGTRQAPLTRPSDQTHPKGRGRPPRRKGHGRRARNSPPALPVQARLRGRRWVTPRTRPSPRPGSRTRWTPRGRRRARPGPAHPLNPAGPGSVPTSWFIWPSSSATTVCPGRRHPGQGGRMPLGPMTSIAFRRLRRPAPGPRRFYEQVLGLCGAIEPERLRLRVRCERHDAPRGRRWAEVARSGYTVLGWRGRRHRGHRGGGLTERGRGIPAAMTGMGQDENGCLDDPRRRQGWRGSPIRTGTSCRSPSSASTRFA